MSVRRAGGLAAVLLIGLILVLRALDWTDNTFSGPARTMDKMSAIPSSAITRTTTKVSASAESVTETCTQFARETGASVSKYNEFVLTRDTAGLSGFLNRRDSAAAALEDAATTVEVGVSVAEEAVPEPLASTLTNYVAAARALATETRKMNDASSLANLNIAGARAEGARIAVLKLCR
ncbi:hypothetical protein [Nocardia aurantiaca]|uniref:Uncharacterized protein n=1 Tax=Nocardia aurantiaca TaxID=2675850 RepID=A0A6I3L194_9NOCA|nr:hypothetical protein [Nocardia aurantiaca]MTE16062.1 hypothetical protein [Nocardia aurantiaca]